MSLYHAWDYFMEQLCLPHPELIPSYEFAESFQDWYNSLSVQAFHQRNHG